MFREEFRGREMQDSRFIAVEPPSPAEGVGRALQAAFRDLNDLPTELRRCVQKLDNVAY